MSKKYFSLESNPYQTGYYTIRPNHEELKLENTKGSYNIFCARLLGLSYAEYLRFCRDVVGANLVGKGSIYVVPYFKKNAITNQFLRLLNARAELLFHVLSHPDTSRKELELEKFKKERERKNSEEQREPNL